MFCCSIIWTILVGSLGVFAVPFALNYTLANFLLFGIFWIIIWLIWGYNVCIGSYYFPGYFFIVCYHLKQRLNAIKIRLNVIRNESKKLNPNEKILTITTLLRKHNDICKQISNYNKYWRKYLTITYSIYLSIICILSYDTLINSKLKWSLRSEYGIVLLAHFLLIFIITYSASTVSHFNLILYKSLNSFWAENYVHFPMGIRIKVSISK